MNTIVKKIDGISCEIETIDGYTDIHIAEGNAKLLREWIVRKAPEAIAPQIASIVIRHRLSTSEEPEEVYWPWTTTDDDKRIQPATPEGEAWYKEGRFVSHEWHNKDNVLRVVINFWIGEKIAFQLAYRTIL